MEDDANVNNRETEERENEDSVLSVEQIETEKGTRSIVWEHYRRVTETIGDLIVEFGYCNYYPKKYKYSKKVAKNTSGTVNDSTKGKSKKNSSSTGNMLKHLREAHPNIQLNIKEDNAPENSEFIFSQDNFRVALLKWIIERDQCMKEPEQPAFLEVIRSLNPYAEAVSSVTLQKDLMELCSEKAKSVKLKLSQVEGKLSFTLAWIMNNNMSFLKIGAHWIDNWKIESDLLDCCHVPDKNALTNACDLFLNCLSQYEIPLSKIMGITLKNVSDNATFINSLKNKGIENDVNISSIGNFVECLHNIVDTSLEVLLQSFSNQRKVNEDQGVSVEETSEAIPPIIEKLRYLIGSIRGSREVQHELKEICRLMGVEFHVLVVDDKSNSIFKMIDQAVQLKKPLLNLCIKVQSMSQLMLTFFFFNKVLSFLIFFCVEHNITETEWSEITTLKDLISKFHRAMNLIPISSHLATLNWLIDSLESVVKNNVGLLSDAFKKCLEEIKKHEIMISNSKIPFVATLLNPALKMTYFKEHNYSKSKMKDIEKAVHDVFKKDYEAKGKVSTEKSEDEDDEFFSHMFKRAKIETLSKVFQNYLRYPLSSPKIDILEYWKLNEGEFPCLAKMARDFLASASSLNYLTNQNSVVEDESISSDHARASICLGYWLKKH